MNRNWHFFFIFCFAIHLIVFAFFPRKHKVDRLPHAQINQFFDREVVPEETAETPSNAELIQDLLFGLIELSQEFSDLGQSNFHLLQNRFYKAIPSFSVRWLLRVSLVELPVISVERPAGIYAGQAVLLPEYYRFLFRLTPF